MASTKMAEYYNKKRNEAYHEWSNLQDCIDAAISVRDKCRKDSSKANIDKAINSWRDRQTGAHARYALYTRLFYKH